MLSLCVYLSGYIRLAHINLSISFLLPSFKSLRCCSMYLMFAD